MTYDEVVALALTMPDTEEALMHGAPSVKRKGRYMFSPGREDDTLAIKLDWDLRDELLERRPDVFFITPHYHGWPALLARLGALTPELAEEIVRNSFVDAPKPSKRRPTP